MKVLAELLYFLNQTVMASINLHDSFNRTPDKIHETASHATLVSPI